MVIVTAVRDRVGDRFLGIDLFPNTEAACRGFTRSMDTIRSNGSDFVISGIDDYELWYLGDFDDQDGVFYDTEKAKILMLGSTVRRQLDEFYSKVGDSVVESS